MPNIKGWHTGAILHREFAIKKHLQKSHIVFPDEVINNKLPGRQEFKTDDCKSWVSCLYFRHILKCSCCG